jgi:hypothetical protein
VSSKVGIIVEGSTDLELLPALLSRIAESVGLDWPVQGEDVGEVLFIRKAGFGGVLEKVRALVQTLDAAGFDHDFYIILLDRKTRPAQEEVRRLIGGRPRFVLGIAIEEIEAWWLADRANTLAWAQLEAVPPGCRYGARGYHAESDDDPKRTLDEITRLAVCFDRVYGLGSTELAAEFAWVYGWYQNAHLDAIAAGCAEGFRPFRAEVAGQFRRLVPSHKRR